MPKIIGRAEQDAAVSVIRKALKGLTKTSDFLAAPNPTGEYEISFKGEDGLTYSTPVYAPEKDVIDCLAKAYRGRIAADIVILAEENRIELDPDEKAIFGLEE